MSPSSSSYGTMHRRNNHIRLQHRLVSALAVLPLTVSALPAASPADSQKVLRPVDAPEVEPQSTPKKLNGRFLHISDFHPDSFYKVHTSTAESIACHRGKGLAGTYGAEKTDCDSPFTLVDATFKWIEENIKDSIDFVVWTGDSARHDSDESLPRHEPEVLESNRIVANKFIDTFLSDDHKLSIPVIPTFGNNDFLPHNIMFPGPNRWFQNYGDIWHRFIPEEQRHSFGFGGWFFVETIPNQLAVFSLNTMYFFDRNAGVDGCAHPSEPGYKQLDWLRVQLAILRERGMKAILMGHVPPARTEGKQLWDETCWQKYTLWLQQYRDVVVGGLYGHMNIDHFLLQDTRDLEPTLGTGQFSTRDALDEEVSIQSKEDYLHELRDTWSGLPKSIVHVVDEEEEAKGKDKKKKHKKPKKKFSDIGGKHAERYQLTLISPSIVPNYFPSLRIIEYNITGLEDATVWTDSFNIQTSSPAPQWLSERQIEDEILREQTLKTQMQQGQTKKEKSKPGRKPPKGHNLIIPDPPPKGSPPGPAYASQPFSLTGYVQYFANLTHINDDIPDDDSDDSDDIVDGQGKWRKGKHDHKKPKHGKPNPRTFHFEVEYSTFHDKVYKLADLTVKNYVKLAYRMGQKTKSSMKTLEEDDDFLDNLTEDEDLDLEVDELDEVDASGGKKKKKKDKKKKKKKKGKEQNKAWMKFLRRAFVSSIPKDELEDM